MTLRNSTGNVVTAPFTVKAGTSSDVVAHLTSDATRTGVVTVFVNDLSPVGRGKTRLVVSHVAVAPPADIRVDGSPLFRNVANGESLSLVVPAKAYSMDIVPTATTGPAILAPVMLTLRAGTLTRVFAIGDPASGSTADVVAGDLRFADRFRRTEAGPDRGRRPDGRLLRQQRPGTERARRPRARPRPARRDRYPPRGGRARPHRWPDDRSPARTVTRWTTWCLVGLGTYGAVMAVTGVTLALDGLAGAPSAEGDRVSVMSAPQTGPDGAALPALPISPDLPVSPSLVAAAPLSSLTAVEPLHGSDRTPTPPPRWASRARRPPDPGRPLLPSGRARPCRTARPRRSSPRTSRTTAPCRSRTTRGWSAAGRAVRCRASTSAAS